MNSKDLVAIALTPTSMEVLVSMLEYGAGIYATRDGRNPIVLESMNKVTEEVKRQLADQGTNAKGLRYATKKNDTGKLIQD